MFEKPIVTFSRGQGFSLVGADIIVDDDEYEGVHIAARNLSKDFAKVTGKGSNNVVTTNGKRHKAKACIFVGTISKSATIQSLAASKTIDTTKIAGKWESWITTCVSRPLEGYDNGLMIIGSDKRAAIFGIYSLSEQIGVSP